MAHILDNPSLSYTQETPHDKDHDDEEDRLPSVTNQNPVQHAAKAPEVPVFDEDEEEEDYSSPAEDVFAMIFFAKTKSSAFFYGCSVFVTQLTILFLIYWDIVDMERFKYNGFKYNHLKVPGLVSWNVTIAQGIALLIAVVSMDDVTKTLGLASFGYNPAVQKQFPGASYSKFIVASVMRFTEGIAVIVVSFVFIVQANSVLDIFLNFAAVSFVASLDDLAYQLAKTGWVGGSMERLVKNIEEVKHLKLRDEWRRFVKPVSMLLLLSAMYGGWAMVLHRQFLGIYLWQSSCKLLIVNFGDEVYPVSSEMGQSKLTIEEYKWKLASRFNKASPPDLHYAFFSGEYKAKRSDRYGRPEYYQNGFYDDVSSGMFYYCKNEKSWVFTIRAFEGTGGLPKESEERCAFGWLMRSPRTEAITLEDVTTDGWRIWTGALDTASDFSITCTGCKTDDDCSFSKRGTCNKHTGHCRCNDGYGGNLCNYDEPCKRVKLFFDDGFGEKEGESGDIYDSFNGSIYGRPAYYANFTWEHEVIFYSGRRWYDAEFETEELDIFDSARDASSYNRFHAYWGNC